MLFGAKLEGQGYGMEEKEKKIEIRFCCKMQFTKQQLYAFLIERVQIYINL